MIRVLLTKSQLDAHDRGILVLSNILREAGMEVIYTRFLSPLEIVDTAIQEDVNIIGISFYAGGYKYVCGEVMQLLAEKGAEDIKLILGGIIPAADIPSLLQMGISRVFGPGTPSKEITDYIRKIVSNNSNQ